MEIMMAEDFYKAFHLLVLGKNVNACDPCIGTNTNHILLKVQIALKDENALGSFS